MPCVGLGTGLLGRSIVFSGHRESKCHGYRISDVGAGQPSGPHVLLRLQLDRTTGCEHDPDPCQVGHEAFVLLDRGCLEPVAHGAPYLSALVQVRLRVLRFPAEVHPSHLVPLLDQPVIDASAHPTLVDAGHVGLVTLDGVDDATHAAHGVVAPVPLDGNDVAPLPDDDHGAVRATACRVDAHDDGC